MLASTQTSQAQDLLARQAPVDRKMKAVDTLALKKLIEREQAETPSVNLYDGWDNKYAHKATELPDTFRINLKHFCMPTPSRVITSNFGARWGRQHKGLDIKVYIGDTIRAAFAGKVRIVKYEANGYGNYVVIRHNNGLETIYGHMSKHLCKENQVVKAGDVIGLGGNTGRSTGSHLHFETRLCGVALDPALLFDFRNQDVTGDYYMFRKADYERKNGKSSKVTNTVASSTNKTKEVAKATEEVSTKKETSSNSSRNNKDKDSKAANTSTKESKDKKNAKKDKKENIHTVAKGESLYSISKSYGISVDELCRLNSLKKDQSIKPGDKLRCS